MTTLGHLASFHAVCQTLNISAAAKALGITQPALSRQLKRLEESLGIALFVRRQRGIALTEEGARLAEAIAPVLTTLDERLHVLRSAATVAKGKLRIGSLAEIGKAVVVPAATRFGRDFPEVEVELRFLTGAEILAGLDRQELDFGVIASLPANDAVTTRPLLEERSILVTRSANARRLGSVGDVLAASFVAYRHDDPLLGAFLARNFPGLGRQTLKPRFAVNDHKSMIGLLLAFDVFAVMPIHSVAGHLESGTLVVASGGELVSTIHLARRARARETRISEGFREALEASASYFFAAVAGLS